MPCAMPVASGAMQSERQNVVRTSCGLWRRAKWKWLRRLAQGLRITRTLQYHCYHVRCNTVISVITRNYASLRVTLRNRGVTMRNATITRITP
eukprot:SAG25_NODE_68_length_17436_cov_79.923055_11_plen_93_part_00